MKSLTPPEPAELARRLQDFAWFSRHFKVEHRTEQHLIPFTPNTVQQQIRARIVAADHAGRPGRFIILKARRQGVSTLLQFTMLHRAITRRQLRGLTIAHEVDNSAYLFGMLETAYRHLPDALRPGEERRTSGRRLDFTNGSTLRVETAHDKEAGRGMAARIVHASEVAFWPNPARTLLALRQTVPRAPGSLLVLESTANGVGDIFHSEWLRAEAGVSGYEPLFFAWHDFPEYRETPPKDFEITDHERTIAAVHGLDAAQLYWRRITMEQECGGDEQFFQQEYPADPTEAFLSTGRRYFGLAIDGFVPVQPEHRGELVGEPKKGHQIGFVRDPQGPLKLWKERDPKGKYLIFMDPAGVVTPDELEKFVDKREAEDYSVMMVVNRANGEVVAQWRSRLDPDLAAIDAFRLGIWFNRAVICVEMNAGHGNTAITTLRSLGYPNLHLRMVVDTYTQERTVKYGWNTDLNSRPLMLDNLRQVLRETPHLLKSADLKAEMNTFVVTNRNRAEADKGCHDDVVMATAGAYELYREYATRAKTTGDLNEYRPTISQYARRTPSRVAS